MHALNRLRTQSRLAIYFWRRRGVVHSASTPAGVGGAKAGLSRAEIRSRRSRATACKSVETKSRRTYRQSHATAVLLFKTRKLIYKTTRIILPRQLTPLCPFICGKPTEFATFWRTVVITPVNNTKHQFLCHRKFKKHRVKRDLG